MITNEQFDRTLAGWFEADARSSAPAGALKRVLDETRRRRPRQAWLADLGSHWLGGASATRVVPIVGVRWSTALVLLLMALAVVGAAILVGARLFQHTSPTRSLGHIAYGVDGDIYVANWDGTNPVRIADGDPITGPESCHGFFGEGAIWSPDGRHLAYRSYWSDVCSGTVYIADPEGHTVASFPGGGWLVSWSPDSTRVATWVEDGKIGIYGLDGTRQATLGPPTRIASGDSDPWWSPDGTSIVVKGGYRLSLDGTEIPQVPLPEGVLSSDGTRIAYRSWLGDTRSLRVAAPDRSDPRVLFEIPVPPDHGDGQLVCEACQPGDIDDMMWSPSDNQIAFRVSGRTMTGTGTPNGLYVVDVASRSLTPLVGAGNGVSLGLIKFAPEGDRILYWVATDAEFTDAGSSVWTVNVDGTNARKLIDGTRWVDWQWLPPGPESP